MYRIMLPVVLYGNEIHCHVNERTQIEGFENGLLSIIIQSKKTEVTEDWGRLQN